MLPSNINRTNYMAIGKKLQAEYDNTIKNIPIFSRETVYNAFAKKFMDSQISDKMFNYTADMLCQILVDMMNAKIGAKAQNLKADARASRVTRNNNNIFFKIENGDYAFNETWSKFNKDGDLIAGSNQQAFSPTSDGIAGTFFEALFLGKKGDNSIAELPDIGNLMEAKTKTGEVQKGEMDVGDLTARFNSVYIKEKVDETIDEGFVRAIAFLKIIEKVANLVVIRTELESDSTTKGHEWIRFAYLAVEVYAKLNLEKIWAAYLKSGADGNDDATEGFYTIARGDVEKSDMREYEMYPEGKSFPGEPWNDRKPGKNYPTGKDLYFAKSKLTVKIKGANLYDGKLQNSVKLYLEMKDLFNFPGGKLAFFDVMNEIEVEQKLWNVTPGAYEWRRSR